MSNYLQKARQAIKEHGPQRAVSAIMAQTITDKGLRDHLLLLGAQQLVRSAQTDARRVVSDIVLPAQAGREARERWVDQQYLYGGTTRLGDATWQDLAASARAYDKAAAGNADMAAFHRKLGEVVKPSGKAVRDVVTDAKAKEIKSSARARTI